MQRRNAGDDTTIWAGAPLRYVGAGWGATCDIGQIFCALGQGEKQYDFLIHVKQYFLTRNRRFWSANGEGVFSHLSVLLMAGSLFCVTCDFSASLPHLSTSPLYLTPALSPDTFPPASILKKMVACGDGRATLLHDNASVPSPRNDIYPPT